MNEELPSLNGRIDNMANEVWQFAQSTSHVEAQLTVDAIPESATVSTNIPEPDANFWASDAGENSYWPFMPFLSQLESLPNCFDLSNLE